MATMQPPGYAEFQLARLPTGCAVESLRDATIRYLRKRLPFPVRSWNAKFGVVSERMEASRLQLKFGTALFTFSSEEQMRAFLETDCYMKDGRIYLHHGDKFHFYTELSAAYRRNVPKGCKIRGYSSQMFLHGGGKKPRRGE